MELFFNSIIELFGFQEKAVEKLLNFTLNNQSKSVFQLKAPTGAGKTIMLVSFIDRLLSLEDHRKYAIVWLTPGQGDLEMQSKKKMDSTLRGRKTQTLQDAILEGFTQSSTTFINWEQVDNEKKNALKEGERANLRDRIVEAHRIGIEFIAIVDEEHRNKTSKAQELLNSFCPVKTIRASATIKRDSTAAQYSISERAVIESGLITKEIWINDGIEEGDYYTTEDSFLVECAEKKRQAILEAYHSQGVKFINPLVIIQFPSGKPEEVLKIEKTLRDMGFTYENGTVAKWLAEEKIGVDEISRSNSSVCFLLMKQAISTGWDCPRAKVLVKLRENMDEDFEIQTLGRIRRMPEQRHYYNALLDNCFVYTFDEKCRNTILSQCPESSFETVTLTLREGDCRRFKFLTEKSDLGYLSDGNKETLDKLIEYYYKTYGLRVGYCEDNAKLLASQGFVFSTIVSTTVVKGRSNQTVLNTDKMERVKIRHEVSTDEDGLNFQHVIDSLQSRCRLKTTKVVLLLRRLFTSNHNGALLQEAPKDFYAFVINNRNKLIEDFTKAVIEDSKRANSLNPTIKEFVLPIAEKFRKDCNVKRPKVYKTNSYEEYTSALMKGRSRCEVLFEKFCEDNKKIIDWVYKNGDSGEQYFSIAYLDGLGEQHLFYPDYLVRKYNGELWVIESKGGINEKSEDMNIDEFIELKFNALKAFAERVEDLEVVNWGFVRYINNELFINNTKFSEDLLNDRDNWRLIKEVILEDKTGLLI